MMSHSLQECNIQILGGCEEKLFQEWLEKSKEVMGQKRCKEYTVLQKEKKFDISEDQKTKDHLILKLGSKQRKLP